MAICRSTIWTPRKKRYIDTLDYGTAVSESENELATEALVFMVVGLHDNFKHLEVLQDRCNASIQAQLFRDCIYLLHEQSLKILALIFNSTYTNQSTALNLGCNMTLNKD